MSTRRRLWPPRSGFSLIELLVAITLLCLISLLLFGIIDSSTKIWRTQEGQEDSFREARAAFSTFSRDLRNFIATSNDLCFFSGTNRFAFLTSVPADSQRTEDLGDIVTVGYAFEWERVDPGNAASPERPALYRYLRFGKPTYDRTLTAHNPVGEIFDEVDGTTTVRELLARNVVSMRCTAYGTNGGGEPGAFIPSSADSIPDLYDFSLTVIGESTAAKLRSRADWTNSAALGPARQNFSIRLHLPKATLANQP